MLSRWLWIAVAIPACGGIAVLDGDGTRSSSSSNASSASSTTTAGVTSSTTGGGNACLEVGTPCADCSSANCATEKQNCVNLSECALQDGWIAGCYALIECALANCPGGADPICVAAECADEIKSGGGINGEGTQAAQSLGACLNINCPECF